MIGPEHCEADGKQHDKTRSQNPDSYILLNDRKGLSYYYMFQNEYDS